MKKILLMIGFMVLVILNYGQPTATLRIEGSDITGLVPNDKVYVSLYFDDITAGALVSGWQFFIEYDHSVLTWDGSFSNPNAGISWLNPKFPNTAGGLFFDNLTESELGYLWGDGGTLASVEPVEKIIELKFTYHGGQTPLNWSTSKEEWTIKSMKGSTQLYDENLDNFTLTLINGCACLPNYDITFHVTENGTNMQDALVTVGSQSILTNASGDAVFNLANGIYSYTVTKAGYYDKTGSFTVSGSNLTIQVPMNLLGSEFDVTFQVTSGGNALEGASVEVDGQIIATNVLGEALFSLPNGDYTYTVSKYGYTSESGSFIVDGGTLTIPVSLAMLPHYDIIFHVTSGGNDLEGALVDIPDVESILTDINGEALFSMVDGDYTYEVSKNGYTTTSGSFTVAGATLVIEVSLEQLFDVTFHVTSGGSDLQGASVTVGTITKFTNANGIAIFSLTNDDYNYVVTKDGYDDETGVFTVAGTNINIEVTMTLITYVVTFHVTSEGNDIEGALVTIDTQSFLTNTNGIAVFNLPDGNYIYSVTKNGYYESNDLFTVEGSNLTIEVELLPYYYDVIFHVTTGGADLEGALVTIGTQSFFTNALGIAMFSLTNGSYNYAVTMAGYDTETGIFTVDNAGMTIEVSMEITVWAITFHVTSAGANLEGALVTIGTQQVTTNASGIALFSLPDGNYTYSITKTNYISQIGPLTVAGAPQTIEINLLLDTQVVTFHIVSTGGGLAGVNVTCNGQTVVTDANGNAVFNLFNGTYDYIAEKPGYHTLTGSITVNNAPLIKNLIMFPITVTFVVTNNSQPIQNAVVTLTGFPPQTTPANGTVVFSVVPNGTYPWTVTHPDFGLAEGEVIVNNANVNVPVMLVGTYDIISSSFDLYPNPSNGTFNLTTTASLDYESDITVFDLTGKLVYTGKLQGNDVNVIDLSAQEKGMYILQIIVEDKVYNKTLVIQ